MATLPHLILALGGLFSGLAVAEVQVRGPIEFGIFESRPTPPAGERVLSSEARRILPTDQVPARLGIEFGMRFQLAGKRADDTPLTLLYLTPGVVDPQGKRHDRYQVMQALVPGANSDVMAFAFSEPHEVVPGEWHFLVFQGDRKLAEQRFQVR